MCGVDGFDKNKKNVQLPSVVFPGIPLRERFFVEFFVRDLFSEDILFACRDAAVGK